jgi:hypothetical protein
VIHVDNLIRQVTATRKAECFACRLAGRLIVYDPKDQAEKPFTYARVFGPRKTNTQVMVLGREAISCIKHPNVIP